MAIEKNKIQGAVLELPAKLHYQFRPFSPFLRKMGWNGSAVLQVALKRLPGLDFFQLLWVLIIHLS